MIRVIVSGAAGHMGRILREKLEAAEDFEITGLVDPYGDGMAENLSACSLEADVAIDFSNHLGTEALLTEAVKRALPVVLCTTGHTEEERQLIFEAAKSIPVFFSANMSLGVAILMRLVRQAAAAFPSDAEIVETHHRRKLDSPSGTALSLARAIQAERPGSEIVCGRAGMQKREPSDIGVQAVRMGNIAGIHEVFFGTDTETLTLKHETHDRGVFADGAVAAARFLAGKPAGLYAMDDLLG